MKRTGDFHIIFVYSRNMPYPPTVDNIKVYYVSNEFIRRGAKVTWLQAGDVSARWERDGIEFVKIGPSGHRLIDPFIQLIRMVAFCRSTDANCVYSDEWLFFRRKQLNRLFLQIGLRIVGVKYVLDQRDPYIDFEVARGNLKEGSCKHRYLELLNNLTFRLTDLAIFPSETYANEFRGRGLPVKSSLGAIRGIDDQQFNHQVDGSKIRSNLGLQNKFVVGWFGMMLPYRQLEEVVIPLIERGRDFIPDVHFLIGGSGELRGAFDRLQNSRPDLGMTVLGSVPYARLPEHLAACDVLLCPLNTEHRFASLTSPLKILESLAVGRPIIATETKVSKEDYKDLVGVVWTGPNYDSFREALIEVYRRYDFHRDLAFRQAREFSRYNLRFTISKIVNAIEEASD